MKTLTRNYLGLAFLALCVKVCLLDSYRSTDFEVHRNWLALTFSLPLRKWYFEDTSKWTLDYPPFFAYFEWAMSQVAARMDLEIVKVSAHPLVSSNIVLFQRGSVMATDCLLLWATARFLSHDSEAQDALAGSSKKSDDGPCASTTRPAALSVASKSIVFGLVALNAGLLLVDHIHFQYNGALLGLLVLCLDFAQRKQYLCTAAAFSTLVLTKHLFVTLAPLFVVFLWRGHCSPPTPTAERSAWRVFLSFMQLAGIALVALLLALGPLIWDEVTAMAATAAAAGGGKVRVSNLKALLPAAASTQLRQILSRLLPFGRGLVHTYWAPNMWALYFAADTVFTALFARMGILPAPAAGVRTALSGTLGDVKPTSLPAVSAGLCLLLVLGTCMPALVVNYKRPTARSLTSGVVYCSLCAFMLGYHVHEKAVLVPMVVQTLLIFSEWGSEFTTSNSNQKQRGIAREAPPPLYLLLVMAAAGVFGLFPLFTEAKELVSKTTLYVVYIAALAYLCYGVQYKREKRIQPTVIAANASRWQLPGWVIVMVFAALHVYVEWGHALLELRIGKKLPFLPLLLTSTVCAVFLIHAWALSLAQVLA